MPELTGPVDPSDKSRGIATALAVVLGPFGAHRFYVGRARSGALMAVTLGGLGLWWLYDLIVVAAGDFRDVDGRRVSRWDPDVLEAAGQRASQPRKKVGTIAKTLAPRP
jgi:hypothetical protein